MRLFLGAYAHLADYASLQEPFSSSFEGKWVKPHNLHVTLYFFGEVTDVETVKQWCSHISYPKESIPIKGLGTFGTPPHVLYAKAKHAELQRCRAELEEYFGKTGHPYKPHVTLLRIKRIHDYGYKRLLGQSRKTLYGEIAPPFYLFKSDPGENNPVCTPLQSYP